jgi:SAM-dependent methyltransferase
VAVSAYKVAGSPSSIGQVSARKERILALAEELAPERSSWIERNSFYYEEDYCYSRFLVPPGQRVLDLGCGNGDLLHQLQPSRGVGVDFSRNAVAEARRRHPTLDFVHGDIEDPAVIERLEGPFDVILLSDTIGSLDDVQATVATLHRLCHAETRLVISYYNRLWAPVLRVGQWLGLQMPQREPNWLSGRDIANILTLADFEVVRLDSRQLLPRRALGLGRVVNRYVGTLPGFRAAALRSYVVARSLQARRNDAPSATIVVPCRNEAGNVAAAVERTPPFCDDLEFIFVEGHSSDDTFEAVEQVIATRNDVDIKLVRQDGVGKGDAVRKGFELARGDVLMILDADLTTPPEDLPKFYSAIATGRGELVMGSRLVYPMEDDAMRVLNTAGNKFFSLVFSWLLNQRITDTLCGTKVLTRHNYDRISAGRAYFGEFDPFGDFDLIFGAAKQNLKIVEVPVRYRARTYGSTQISRFRHGLLLLRMTAVAYRRLKAV